MNQRNFYAHSLDNEPESRWQPLEDHLLSTAKLAGRFASFFKADLIARIAGLLHDLGKYADQFQRRLHDPSRENARDHSTAGVAAILSCYKHRAEAAALAVEGHHIGLKRIRTNSGSRRPWENWLGQIAASVRQNPGAFTESDFQLLMQRFRSDGLELSRLRDYRFGDLLHNETAAAAAMLDVRMLFSALVDADFIDTEAHFNSFGDQPRVYRPEGPPLTVDTCLSRLNEYLESLRANHLADPAVQTMRDRLMDLSVEAARMPTGVFTLTAPTGAGKTLAMLAFALNHAKSHGLRRVVLVMPYLNIIEQTAEVYGDIFGGLGPSFVIEDHSLAHSRDDRSDEDCENESARLKRLLAENWDAPVILTTSVKCLESLMANRHSLCRKLHRLARSVILFDEVQTLPPKLVVPTLATLSRLADPNGPYRCSVVFSTATQPAFDHLHSNVVRLNPAGWQPHEIVQNFHHMFNVAAQRTKVTWRYDQPVEVCDLANELIPHDQVLGIVNLKRHAVELAKILQQSGAPGLYHLSTNMCPAHRRDVLDEVQGPLDKNRPVRLIATQCVEAGVDLDFPIVYRALAPLDALAQAAGRCNRHGRHSKPGKVVIFQFVSDGRSLFPPGYKEGVQATEIFLNNLKTKYADLDGVDIFNNPELLRSYYKQFYDLTGHGAGTRDDEENLLRTIQEGDFEKVAQLYKLIDQDQINILVPYNQDKFEQLLRQMQPEERRNLETIRRWIGQARPYTVSLFRPGQKSPVWSYIAPIQFSKHDERRGDEAHWFYLLPTAQYDNLLGIMFPEELIF